MGGLDPQRRDPDDPLHAMMQRCSTRPASPRWSAPTASRPTHRYLRPGERGRRDDPRWSRSSGPSRPASARATSSPPASTWCVGDEPVATMLFRVLKFDPAERRRRASTAARHALRPVVNRDTAFFWDGTAPGELRIQRCSACGALRHPPGPGLPARAAPRTAAYVVASGRGTVYSYVVHHHPPVPGQRAAVRGRAGRAGGGRADARRAARTATRRRSTIGDAGAGRRSTGSTTS